MRKRSIIWGVFMLLGGFLLGCLLAGYVGYRYKSYLTDIIASQLKQDVSLLIKLRNDDVDGGVGMIEMGLDNAVRQLVWQATDRQGRFDPGRLSPRRLRALQAARSYMDAGFKSPFSSEAKQYLSQIMSPTCPVAEFEGKTPPDFTLDKLDDGKFTLSKEKAHVVVLEFWASRCGPCLAALPGYENLHKWAKAQDKSVAVYCINIQEDQEIVARLWTKRNFSMPVLLDRDGEVAKAYRVDAIPQCVIIAEGILRYAHVGLVAANEENLRTRIEALLSEIS
ncbi:MAG TPA: TlpA disulfide reductase family protein [Sedimentisphaerales bacterium]|nr:TlpA disulfide reductase family protein [Sedimentisphaerales bacterium]